MSLLTRPRTPHYRVKAFSRREPESYGYVGYKTVHYQHLQIKRWWGWQTLDAEVVPCHVRISMGAFGDTGGWESKFAEFGRWDRDGLMTLHPSTEITCA